MTSSDDAGHPANPYAGEVATALRLQDREGYPFAARRKANLSDEAQLGAAPEPPLMIRVIRGKLKHMDPVKGFGFIVPLEAGPDVFLLHRTLKESGYSSFIPGAGCGIEVEAVDRGRGMIAIKVRWVEWTP